jgi:hypothetical protein
MGKKCIVCGEPAQYSIKGTSDYYCEECAIENFSDLELLQKVEEKALMIKEMIKEKMEEKKRDEEQYVPDDECICNDENKTE